MLCLNLMIESSSESSVPYQEQWEADSVRQTVDKTPGKGKQSPYLLSDGEDVGYSGRVPDYQTLPFPGKMAQLLVSYSLSVCLLSSPLYWSKRQVFYPEKHLKLRFREGFSFSSCL